AGAIRRIAPPVVCADERLAVDPPERQWRAAVHAQVAKGAHLSTRAVDRDALAEQRGSDGLVDDVGRQSEWIPVGLERLVHPAILSLRAHPKTTTPRPTLCSNAAIASLMASSG